ncbi:MAG: carbohydrate-binding domain-containing protein [Clostridiales bacterium]|nr:carbohydrate-binding domain-containing protein [Clostridiales bacterium]
MKLKKLISALCCLVIGGTCVACYDAHTPNNNGGGKPDYSDGKPTDTDNKTPGDIGGEIPDDNNVDVPEPDGTEHSFELISQADGTLTYKCADCNVQETVTITCVSGTANAYTAADNTITFHNISEKSVYDISGSLHGNIVVDVGDSNKYELQMSGLTVNSASACPITVVSGDKVTLSAKKSTENYIYDLRAAVDTTDNTAISASVYAECDLDIQGKGSLTVKSVNNNGVHTKNDLNVKNLDLQVDCMDNALKGNDGVTIEGGNVVLISRQGDGIKTTDSDVSKKGNQRGTVAITGGDVLIYAACDGIDAAYDVNIDQSSTDTTLQIFTDKYSKYSEEVTATAESTYYVRFNSSAYKYSLKFYNDDTDAVWQNSSSVTMVGSYRYYPIPKPSGYSHVQLYIYNSTQQQGQDEEYVACTEGMTVNNNYDTIALQTRGGSLSYSWTNYTTSQQGGRPGGGFGGPGGMNDGNTDKGNHSTKGIKASNAVAISAGNITVSAYDDAIHANNDTTLENGEAALGNVTISGGDLTLRSNDDGLHADNNVAISGGTINIVSSYEGIEGTTVEITDGDITVKSNDDGINGTAKSGTAITISRGKLYVYASGDGVDSNSTTQYEGIHFVGGRSVIISTGQADSGIDTERGYKYSGGYVVAVCKSGGMGSESTNCQSFTSVGTSKTMNLQKDGYLTVDGIATVKMPAAINALVVCLGKTNATISSGTTAGGTLDSNGVWWNV